MQTRKILPVIMSGGAGSRLWPLSRSAMPKQLLPLLSDQTMVQETVARVSGDIFLPPVFVCNAAHTAAITAQMANIGQDVGAIIVEPIGRNTAPCAVAAAVHAKTIDGNPLVLLLPADHHVAKQEAFRAAINQAMNAALSGHLVTFGIMPDGPETGYGYIERGAALDDYAYHVNGFREKPDIETAQTYLSHGGYSWNAGIFLFAAETLLSEMSSHAPEIRRQAETAYHEADNKDGVIHLSQNAFSSCPSQSIDYAVMEPTDKAAIVPADIGWSDIGSYAALHEMIKDKTGNAVSGDVLIHNVNGSLIDTDGPLVSVVGLDNVAVIIRDDQILVTALGACQNVKEIVNQLKTTGRKDDL